MKGNHILMDHIFIHHYLLRDLIGPILFILDQKKEIPVFQKTLEKKNRVGR